MAHACTALREYLTGSDDDGSAIERRARQDVVQSDDVLAWYRVRDQFQSYMLHQGKKFVRRFDANTYLRIIDMWSRYDATAEGDHEHKHYHDEKLHEHRHKHSVKGIDGFVHSHGDENPQDGVRDLKDKRAGWGLVAILGLTPCIALLPLTFAAIKYGTGAVILVNIAFTIGTLGTIVLFTWLGYLGLSWIKLDFFEKYGDVIAGAIIGLLGLATKVFEL